MKENNKANKIKIINSLFCRLLKIDKCNNDESFLLLGGSSFEFAKLQMEIKKELGVKISLKELYRNNSVDSIVAMLEKKEKPEDKRYPLTDMQSAVYIGRKEGIVLGGKASRAYFELECDTYDAGRFNNAVDELIKRQPFLRASFKEGYYTVAEGVKASVREYDVSKLKGEELKEALLANRRRQFEIPIDEEVAPLADFAVSKMAGDRAIIHVTYDGLVSDGEGLEIFIKELDRIYGGAEALHPCRLDDYYLFLEKSKSGEGYAEDSYFWNNKLDETDERAELPILMLPEKVQEVRTKQIVREFTDETWTAVTKLAKEYNTTVFAMLLTIFGKVISLYSSNHNFFLNIPISVRPHDCKNIENTIGLFSNFTFLAFDDSENLPIADTAAKIQEALFDCQEHSAFAGTDILKLFRNRNGASIPAPVTFTSTIGNDAAKLKNFKKKYVRTYTSQNWIEAMLTELSHGKVFFMNYETNIISDEIAEGISDCFIETIEILTSGMDKAKQLRSPAISRKEYEIIGSSALKYDKNSIERHDAIGEMLKSSFETNKEHTAIVCGSGSVTYGELREQSQSFLRYLKEKCGKMPERAALIMSKSKEQIIVSAAFMCAGIPYMPLDTELPEDVQRKCIKNIGADILITNEESCMALEDSDLKILCCREEIFSSEIGENLFADTYDPEGEAVIINTSGTTGLPKSVSVLNKGLSNCIVHSKDIMNIDYKPIALAVTSICHDMSLYDIYGILTLGGTIVIPDEKKRKEPVHWHELIMENGVNFWNSVPAFMEMLTLLDDERRDEAISSLKTIVMGGDWISPALIEKIRKASAGTEIYSVGGPTETTLWNICHHIKDGEERQDWISYGQPFPETSYFILNRNGALCPIGVAGVMYVTGTCVTAGYIGDEAETQLKYVDYDGERAYNTGDRGVYLKNGEIRILGRDDFQVKINGKRVELTGIENVIKAYPEISSCIVLKDETRGKLAAFYISEKEIDVEELKEHLSNSLQSYMIPYKFIRMDEFPITRQGKTDRKEIGKILAQSDEKFRDEQDEGNQSKEKIYSIAEACREIFDDESITEEDDFYEIGGDSIAAMKLSAWIKDKYGVEIQVFDILSNPSMNDIAGLIEEVF